MKTPSRCNRRDCQARRTLSKPPELYARWPTCHIAGCSGKMYVDRYRLRRGPHDNAPQCRDPFCLVYTSRGRVLMLHRLSNTGCSGHESYTIERKLANSKHRPIKPAEYCDF